MKIKTYSYRGPTNAGINFQKVGLRTVNLLVGDTGTGKTKFLNTIFNLGKGAVSPGGISFGTWELSFEIANQLYLWNVESVLSPRGDSSIQKELLKKINPDGTDVTIVNRTPELFEFNGKNLPKLPSNVCSIFLLKAEDDIAPIHRGFSSIIRRNFSQDEMSRNATYEMLPIDLTDQLKRFKKLEDLFRMLHSVNVNLYFLSQVFKETFSQLVRHYRDVFPFITDIAIKDLSELHPHSSYGSPTPVFCIREKNVSQWIEYAELSSGMQKVLLILTDTILLPEGGIYLIDEYENSLGINSINFFPSYLLRDDNPHQFIITSHHPYIINQIPSSNWFVFHREGVNVSIMYGEQLTKRFAKSKQQAFLQLINDPFYTKGIQQN